MNGPARCCTGAAPQVLAKWPRPCSSRMRSPNRKHERQSFFKYMPAATAKLVLENRTLRWSSPLLFNDPFDVPRELSYGLSDKDMADAVGRKVAQLIQKPPDDTTKFTPGLQQLLELVKRGLAPGVKEKMLAAATDGFTPPTMGTMEELRAIWRTDLSGLRILCVTESPAHVAMWCHYADRYSGAVLEFRCVDELDTVLLGARPVTYPKDKPEIYTADGWANFTCLNTKAATEAMMESATYTKAPDWSYEAEWRIVSAKRPGNAGLFSDYKFFPEELAAVCLGPLISPDDRAALIAAAAAYPIAQIKNVEIGMSREFLFCNVKA